jgi:hypothetical protein
MLICETKVPLGETCKVVRRVVEDEAVVREFVVGSVGVEGFDAVLPARP